MSNIENPNTTSEIILYSNDCPRCKVLKKKLDNKNIKYNLVTDDETMLNLNILSVPMLSVDGKMMNFDNAVKWVNDQKDEVK